MAFAPCSIHINVPTIAIIVAVEVITTTVATCYYAVVLEFIIAMLACVVLSQEMIDALPLLLHSLFMFTVVSSLGSSCRN